MTFRRSSPIHSHVSERSNGRAAMRHTIRSPLTHAASRWPDCGLILRRTRLPIRRASPTMRAARSQPRFWRSPNRAPRMRATRREWLAPIAARYGRNRNAGLLRANSDASGPSRGIANAHWFAARNRSARSRAADRRDTLSRAGASRALCRRGPSQCKREPALQPSARRGRRASAGRCAAECLANRRCGTTGALRRATRCAAVAARASFALVVAAACGIGIPLRFQSYEFWLFFAIVAALFYLLPRRYGRIVL